MFQRNVGEWIPDQHRQAELPEIRRVLIEDGHCRENRLGNFSLGELVSLVKPIILRRVNADGDVRSGCTGEMAEWPNAHHC